MIEIPVQVTCDMCSSKVLGTIKFDNFVRFTCILPAGWTQEDHERREGNFMTEVKKCFCPDCS